MFPIWEDKNLAPGESGEKDKSFFFFFFPTQRAMRGASRCYKFYINY